MQPDPAKPATTKDLRGRLAELHPDARLAWLTTLLRTPPGPPRTGGGVDPWRLVPTLIVSHPGLLHASCEALIAEPETRQRAIALLARLHNRREEWDNLRNLLERWRDEPEEGREARRRELLRTEILAPSETGERQARIWDACAAALCPLGLVSYASQLQVARGLTFEPQALLVATEAALATALQPGLPPILASLARAADVAVIGNGSGLVGARLGSRIDRHDFVIRLNYPVLTGHAPDVGQRTDLMLFADALRHSLSEQTGRERGYDAIASFGVRTHIPDRSRSLVPPRIPRGLAAAVGALGYERPSTGFFAILLVALVLRRPTTIYGFDFYQGGGPAHYFGAGSAAMQHEITYERWFVQQFLPALPISLRTGAAP
ncbi:glycosyltransferase family 29 protein [Falsiroseomonas sp. E2-1-a20]|uniref:glycosyltransferase family 29 protein n=1 Tax=Falsiroseomonas sp. E2-1-a20 TaxID=3239300 RepID=UPI003F3DA6ED